MLDSLKNLTRSQPFQSNGKPYSTSWRSICRCSSSSAVESISSLKNDLVKCCVKLRQSRNFRQSKALVLVVGETPLTEICYPVQKKNLTDHADSFMIDTLLFTSDLDLDPDWWNKASRIVQVTPAVMAKIAGIECSDGVRMAGIVPFPAMYMDLNRRVEDTNKYDASAWYLTWSMQVTRLLALEGIQDPGNIGTLLRTATAFAWDGVYLLPGCCDPFNDKALRASRGASYRIPVIVGDWSCLLSIVQQQNIALYCADPPDVPDNGKLVNISDSAKSLDEAAAQARLCLVLGSEGRGLSAMAKSECKPIAIPTPGDMESLNVAVAGAILMYILKRNSI